MTDWSHKSGEVLVRLAGAGIGDGPADQRMALAELTRRLGQSSSRLERVTWVLASLTLALVGLTIALLVVKA